MRKNANAEQEKGNTAVASKANTAVGAAIDYTVDAGAGMENTSTESFAIPFLAVLQSNSPQCVEGDAKYIPEAKPGMLMNTVTNALYSGKEGALFVPSAYKRSFLLWGPRQGEGGGFKGEHTAEQVAEMRASKKLLEVEGRLYEPLADGTVNPKRCNRMADTRLHYGILIDEKTGEYGPVLFSLTSTQIKKSKQLMSALSTVRVTLQDGRKIQPPTFANVVRITTVPESNDQGNWFGVKLALEGRVEDAGIYADAKAFHDNVLKGLATANYEAAAPEAGGEGRGEGF